jgi:ring-1,2-phenylacetyl-CoA epoxidase subunit PaaA
MDTEVDGGARDAQVTATTAALPTTGSSPSLLLSVLGDLVLPSGGESWLGALTGAMADLGVAPTTTRQALRRLVTQDIVRPERHGRLASYVLTEAGTRRLEEAAERIYLRRSLAWDGQWRMLTYSFSEQDRASRDALRRELAWLGYGSLAGGLWVCPWDLGTRRDAVLAKHDIAGEVRTFTADHDGDDAELASRAYDLPSLRAAHASFLDDVAPMLERFATDGPPLPAEALRDRVLLVHRWRKLLFLDPGLPEPLVPTDWLGDRAADAFLTLYRALEAPAWQRWRDLGVDAAPDDAAPTVGRSPLGHIAAAHDLDVAAHAPDAHDDPRTQERSSMTATMTTTAGTTPTVGSPRTSSNGSNGGQDPVREEEFLAALREGHKVEPADWMPDTYRQLNIKFIEMHANSEIMGALPEREWIARAPTLKRKRSLAAKVQDEVGHAHLIYRVAESLGRPRKDMYEDLIAGKGKFHNVFHYPTYTWGDVACIGFLVDGAAIVTQRALLETSYAPYVRVMKRVVAEESLHYRHGEDILLALASGTDEQAAILQEAVNRWWEPIMHFFGNDIAAEDDPSIRWGIKSRTNEQSRQEWMSTYVPKLWDLGVETPDPELRYDTAAQTWRYSEPDWAKLKEIVKGTPTEATASRLYWRQLLHRNHQWIHDIVLGDDVSTAA